MRFCIFGVLFVSFSVCFAKFFLVSGDTGALEGAPIAKLDCILV